MNEIAEEKVSAKKEIEEKKERRKEGKVGIAYVFSSPNNTIVHITDLAGKTIARISGGMVSSVDCDCGAGSVPSAKNPK